MLRKVLPALLVICGIAVYLHAQTPSSQPSGDKHVTESGLTIINQAPGDWVAQDGDTVYVHYTGTLQSTGAKFDSSYDRKEPISFTLGQGRVIKGWEEGLKGMKLGEKRHLIIPPSLGYGDRDMGDGKIPPNSTLEFDVQLVGLVRNGGATSQ